MSAPERIYAWDNLDHWLAGQWGQKRYPEEAVEYVRADLHAAALNRIETLREKLADIADPKRLASHGDPVVLRDYALAALAGTETEPRA